MDLSKGYSEFHLGEVRCAPPLIKATVYVYNVKLLQPGTGG